MSRSISDLTGLCTRRRDPAWASRYAPRLWSASNTLMALSTPSEPMGRSGTKRNHACTYHDTLATADHADHFADRLSTAQDHVIKALSWLYLDLVLFYPNLVDGDIVRQWPAEDLAPAAEDREKTRGLGHTGTATVCGAL